MCEGGADDGGDQRAGDEGEHVEHAFQLAPPARQAAQQQRRDHERQRVPDRLTEDRSKRRRIVPEQEIADHDARPQPNAVQEQHGEAQARRRPQGRHRTVEIGELEADPSRQVIAQREQRNGTSVEHDTAVPGRAPHRDRSAHAVAALVRASSKRCRHDPRAESNRVRRATAIDLVDGAPDPASRALRPSGVRDVRRRTG
jgi:hypothetical protein